MTTKPPWTDEEKFWRNIRRALLELVNAIETYRLSEHIDIPTSQIRKHLRTYQRVYTFPPIAAEDVREHLSAEQQAGIAELTAERQEVLTIERECDKL